MYNVDLCKCCDPSNPGKRHLLTFNHPSEQSAIKCTLDSLERNGIKVNRRCIRVVGDDAQPKIVDFGSYSYFLYVYQEQG